MGNDDGTALAGGGGRRARAARDGCRHPPLRVSRPRAGAGFLRRAGARHRRSRRGNGGLRAAACMARSSPHGACAAHGRPGAGHAARAAVRPDRRARPRMVQRRTHGRRDAGRRRRRRAAADLLRRLPAAARDRRMRADHDLRDARVVGRADGRDPAGRGARHARAAAARASRGPARGARPFGRVQGVRRGVSRRGAGPADAEGVRAEQRVRREAGREGARCRTARSGCSRSVC